MTSGLVLLLVGVQLNMVETLVLSRTATVFLNERLSDPFESLEVDRGGFMGLNSPSQRYSQNNYGSKSPGFFNAGFSNQKLADTVSYLGPQRTITPPPWLCWPIIFSGAVTFLYGAALGRG
jgi:hypothetical protein